MAQGQNAVNTGLPPVTANTIDELLGVLEAWRAKAHVIGSATIQQIPSMHRVVLEVVWIDPNEPQAIYPTKDGTNARLEDPVWGLGYTTLRRLEQAAGITWDTRQSRRTDDGSDPYVIEYEAGGRIRDLSGMVRTVADCYRLDFKVREEECYRKAWKWWKERDSTPENRERYCREKAREEMLAIRKHGLARAVSGAKARVIVSLLGLRRAGWRGTDLINKPFVIAKCVPNIDYANDPMAHAMLVASHSGLADMAFASGVSLFSSGMLPAPAAMPAPLTALPPGPAAPAPGNRMIEAHAVTDEATAPATQPKAPETAEGGAGEVHDPLPPPDDAPPAYDEGAPPPDDTDGPDGAPQPPATQPKPGVVPTVEDFVRMDRAGKVAVLRDMLTRLPEDRQPRKPLDSMTDDGLFKWFDGLRAEVSR